MKFPEAVILCPILLTFGVAYSQKITISGNIKEATSIEALIIASALNASTKTITITNQHGFFSLIVPAIDTIELIISFTGHSIQANKFNDKQNLHLDIFPVPMTTTLGEVTVLQNGMTAQLVNENFFNQLKKML